MSWRDWDVYKGRSWDYVGHCSGDFGDGRLVVVGWIRVRICCEGGEKEKGIKRGLRVERS
jgi:hypothetical protein